MMVFGGFELPVQYTSIRDEHAAVRKAAGLFDVSHMGQIALSGPEALAAADRLFTRSVASLAPGRIRYGLLCNDEGGVVDDVTCYRVADDELFFCVNAANIDKDYRWIDAHCPAAAGVRNDSDGTGMLALQGPASAAILRAVGAGAAEEMRRFRFARLEVDGSEATVSRTGYTGSDPASRSTIADSRISMTSPLFLTN